MSFPETEKAVLPSSSPVPQDPAEGNDWRNQEKAARARLTRRNVLLLLGVVLVALLAVAAAMIAFWPRAEAIAQPPSDFPASGKLPLVDGEIVPSDPIEGNLSMVSVIVADQDAQMEALERLADAGFVRIGESGSGPNETVTSLSGSDLSVRVEFGLDNKDQYTVTYTAAPKASTGDAKEEGGSDAPLEN